MKSILVWFKTIFAGTWLATLVEELFYSINNNPKRGASGKKVTIIVLVYCVLHSHEVWLSYAISKSDFSLFPMILGADFTTILALFGINEYGKKKVNTLETAQTDSSTVSDDTTTTQSETTTT